MPDSSRSAPVDLLRRPLELLWAQHTLIRPLAGQAHLSVPLAGGPPRPEAATRITRQLQQQWVRNPLTAGQRVTSVAATIVADPAPTAPAPHRLILVLTFDPTPAGEDALDAAHMGRHLELALASLG